MAGIHRGIAAGAPGRDETPAERLDRNLEELLQELRVAQNGVQILFAFLLTMPFQQRFAGLSSFERDLYVVTLVLSALAVTLLIAPVSFHRIVFRLGLKGPLVEAADLLAKLGLLALAASMTCAVLLVLDVVLHSWVAWALSALAACWFAGFWYSWPLTVRARARRHGVEAADLSGA